MVRRTMNWSGVGKGWPTATEEKAWARPFRIKLSSNSDFICVYFGLYHRPIRILGQVTTRSGKPQTLLED
jgi:hypothetical protein